MKSTPKARTMARWNKDIPIWKWCIIIHRVNIEEAYGSPIVTNEGTVGLVTTTTGSSNQEEELLYILSNPSGELDSILRSQANGKYRLVVLKETPSSAMGGTPNYGFYGQAIVSKNKDVIFWENKYFQIGELNKLNLQTRDPQEETRRGHYSETPGGGVDIPWW